MGSQLRAPISPRAIHLCVDMQNIFMPGAPWETPWMSRVAPVVEEIAGRFAANTIFTRFITPAKPEDMPGMWQLYYKRWHKLTRAKIEPRLLDVIPRLKRLVPPATVVDKMHYSPFTESNLLSLLEARETDTLVITGAERTCASWRQYWGPWTVAIAPLLFQMAYVVLPTTIMTRSYSSIPSVSQTKLKRQTR